MHKKAPLLLLAFAILFDFTGCSSMSAQARRERAYRHYVQKQTKHRQREVARAQKAARRQIKAKMKLAQPSDPQVTTSVQDVSDSPSVFQPVAPPQSPSEPAPGFKEPTVDPITVSASDSMPSEPQP